MLNICTWWWGTKYEYGYVMKLVRGLRRHCSPFRMILVTIDIAMDLGKDVDQVITIQEEDRHLLKMKGCLARLRMFDPEWQSANNIEGRLVCLDLDTVITGPLDKLFDLQDSFVILQGANASNPCPYTGAMMMLRTGTHAEVWDDFDLERLATIPKYEFADDQGWIAHKLPGAAGWKAGADGVYAFMKPGWPNKHGGLPDDARIVTFPGYRDPAQFKSLPWVQKHWS
jgi:hypothetical protein